MDFYSSISRHYESIFPLNNAQVKFVKERVGQNAVNILDIGCATGELAEALLNGSQVTGIDLDEEMVDIASGRSRDNLEFKVMDMNSIDKMFGAQSFDMILCFGNTLVHLDDEDTIGAFLKKAKAVLKPGGKLLLQIVNYDYIIDHDIQALPEIDNEVVKFDRYYEMEGNRLKFDTILTIKEGNLTYENSIYLIPYRPETLNEALKAAGFEHIYFYNSFRGDEFQNNTTRLVVEAY